MIKISQSAGGAKKTYSFASKSVDYNRYQRDFKRLLAAKGISGFDAEDIIQDAMLKLLGVQRDLSPEQIQPYLTRIVINTMHDHRKLAARQKHKDYEMVKFQHTDDQALQVETKLRKEYVLENLQELAGAKQHTAFRDYYFSGKKVREISASRKMAMGTVSCQIKRSRDQVVTKLKTKLASQNIIFVGNQPLYL